MYVIFLSGYVGLPKVVHVDWALNIDFLAAWANKPSY